MTDTQRPPATEPTEEQQVLFDQEPTTPQQPSPPEVFLSKKTEQKTPAKRSLRTKIGAGVAGAVLLAGGAFALSQKDERPRNTTGAGANTEETAPPATTATTTGMEVTSPSGATEDYRLLSSDKKHSFTRASGEVVEVPMLRDPKKDSAAFAESYWANFSAYLSIADDDQAETFMESFTTESAREEMRYQRDNLVAQYYAHDITDLQVVIGSPDSEYTKSPTYDEQSGATVLTSGKVNFQLVDNGTWQELYSYSKSLPIYQIDSAEITTQQDASGNILVSRFVYTADTMN